MSTHIVNALSYIDEQLISEAEDFVPKKHYKASAVKIGAISLAACLILVLLIPLLKKPTADFAPTLCTSCNVQTFSFAEMQTHHVFGQIFPKTLPKDYHPDGEIYVMDDTTVEAVFCNHFTGDIINLIISPKRYFAGIDTTDKVLYHENEEAGVTSYIYVDTGDYIGYFFSEKSDLATLEGFDKMIESMK